MACPCPELVGANCGPPQAVSPLSRLLVRMRVSVLAMFVAVLTVRVGRRRVLLGLLVLPVGVVMRRLEVVMGGRMVVGRRHRVMLDGRMLVLFCHVGSS